jgi:hypothetical protein
LDTTNGYGVNSLERFFVETASPSMYLKQSAALGTYKYTEFNFGSADRFRIYIENLNPPSVVTVLDLNQGADTASFGAIGTFQPPRIEQISGYDALINPPYGEMYQDDTGTNVVLTLQNTWYPIASGYTDNAGSGVTRGTGTGQMTPTEAGSYLCMWSVSGTVNQNAQQLELGILKNGATIQPASIQEEQFISSGVTYNCSGQGVVTFNGTTDYVQVAINNNTSAARTFTVDHVTLTLLRIHQ